jgi:outer membrane immunogenic protein
MRRYTLAVLAAAGLALGVVQTASAADIARPVYKAPPPVMVGYNWTGFYAGIHGGYGWGDIGGTTGQDGWFGGGQIGWNWQGAGSPWVFGVEVDSAWANLKDDVTAAGTVFGVPVVANAFSELNYFGTARMRLGYAFDRAMIYATGGLAWGRNEIGWSAVTPAVVVGQTISNTHVGYAVGGGMEWALMDNWTAKVEYLYLDLGSKTYDFGPAIGIFDADVSAHTVKVGLNYRFGYGKGPVTARY